MNNIIEINGDFLIIVYWMDGWLNCYIRTGSGGATVYISNHGSRLLSAGQLDISSRETI